MIQLVAFRSMQATQALDLVALTVELKQAPLNLHVFSLKDELLVRQRSLTAAATAASAATSWSFSPSSPILPLSFLPLPFSFPHKVIKGALVL